MKRKKKISTVICLYTNSVRPATAFHGSMTYRAAAVLRQSHFIGEKT